MSVVNEYTATRHRLTFGAATGSSASSTVWNLCGEFKTHTDTLMFKVNSVDKLLRITPLSSLVTGTINLTN